MSQYNQYGHYYDSVGSQASRPSGYSYSTSPSTAGYQNAGSSSGYGGSYGSNYQRQDGTVYSNQQNRADATQPTSSGIHGPAALSSLSGQGTSGNRTSSNNQYDKNSWYPAGSNPNVYSATNMSVPSRTQGNNSPLYSSAQSASTFGKLSVPEQSQSSSGTFGASQAYQNTNPSSSTSSRSYQTAYPQQPQSQPQRYNSPLHAVQAQHRGHGKQSSRSSNNAASPQMAQPLQSQQPRKPSASVEPSRMTVDPSQVDDNRAELQHRAAVEAEKRRKHEAEQAAKKAEEKKVAEEKRKEEEKKKAEEDATAKKAEQEHKNAQRQQAREDNKQSKSAATTLQQMAQGMAEASASGGDEEVQMRAMFQKMREFNATNPELLAKLWDEERTSHEASKAQSPHQPAPMAAGSSKAASAPRGAASHSKIAKAPARPGLQPKPKSAGPSAPPIKDQPLPQSKPDKPAAEANSSLWPPHKKSSLSEATAKWLNTMPENSNVYVASRTVLNILNDNPSYVELCRSLERLGLKFDRSQLARELLRAVPDGLKSQSIQPSTPLVNATTTEPQPNGSSASPGSSKARGQPQKDVANQRAASAMTVNYEAPISLSDAAREVNSMYQTVHRPSFGSPVQKQQRSPQVTQPQFFASGSRRPSYSHALEIKLEAKTEEPPRLPADKEEAARKRTFGDLVDLTADDSDDEAPPSKKPMQVPPGTGPAPALPPTNGPAKQPHHWQKPISFNQFMHRPIGQNQYTGQSISLPGNGATQPPQASAVQQPAQPMPPPKQKGPTPEQLQLARTRGKMLVEPIMRDRVARKSNYDSRTIARDVLLATGRHPDMRGLNAHFSNMQKLLGSHGGEFDSGGNRSDLSTIKWDVIDPVPPKEEKAKLLKSDDEEQSRPASRDLALPTTNAPKHGSPPISEDRLIKKPPVGKSGRPRGRPPRNRLPVPSEMLTNDLGTPNSTPARQASSSRPATPSSAPMASGANLGYAAFNQINPDGTKKKGRPFGWKKNVHSREAQGLPAKTHPTGPVPSRLKKSAVPAQETEPHFQEYKCNWEGCNHKLINLDTLKKHVVKVHGKSNERGDYFCFWKDCKGTKLPGLGAGRILPAKFDSIEPWIEHVENTHLRSIAWKLGDGPKGGVAHDTSHFFSSPDTTPSYLSDSRGRSVTPIISPPMPAKPSMKQPSPEETTNLPPQPAVKKPGRPPKHGGTVKATTSTSTSGRIDDDPELSKLAQHQRLVGPLLDKMGCALASDERRTTFLDDEDFEDEGFGSEHDMKD